MSELDEKMMATAKKLIADISFPMIQIDPRDKDWFIRDIELALRMAYLSGYTEALIADKKPQRQSQVDQ